MKPTLTAALLSSLAFTASAANHFDFEQHDTNGDGYLTEAEWQDAGSVAADFATVDANGDGYLDEQEIEAIESVRGEGAESFTDVTSDAGEPTPEEDWQGTGYDPLSNDPAENDPASVKTEAAAADGFRDGRRATEEISLDDLDENNDNRISRQEAQSDDRVRESFVLWDNNQDGYLNRDELSRGEKGDTETEALRGDAFEEKDVDGDGRISREETSAAEQFDTLDSNRDGYLDRAEVNYEPGERDMADAAGFEDYDADSDGKLSRDEAANDTYINANFDAWDTNNDNQLEEEEVNNGWLNESTTVPDEETRQF